MKKFLLLAAAALMLMAVPSFAQATTYYLKLDFADANLYLSLPSNTSDKVTVSTTPCALYLATFNGNNYITRTDGNYYLSFGTANKWDMYAGADVGGEKVAKITYDLANTALKTVNPNDGGATRFFAVNSNADGQQVYGDKTYAQSHWKLILASDGTEVTDAATISYKDVCADYDGTSPIFCPTNNTNYASWGDAIGALSSQNCTMCLYQSISNSNRLTIQSGNTINIIPMVDGIEITRGQSRTSMWFLTKSSGNSTLNIGCSEHQLTIKGGGVATNSQDLRNAIFKRELGVMKLTNIKFKDIQLSTEGANKGYLYAENNASGRLELENITIENCRTMEEAFIKQSQTSNDGIYLRGYFNVDSKSGAQAEQSGPVVGRSDILAQARLRMGAYGSSSTYSGFSATNGLVINWNGSKTLGAVVVAKGGKSLSSVSLANDILDLGANSNDLYLTQAYTATIGEAKAATLVLPFESTIPEGVKAYTLNYTAGNDYVKATEVETTLPANTPVLLNAEAGSYKFVTTATSGDAAEGTDPVIVGALTGVYAETLVPDGSYILTKHDTGVGFRKADGTTNKVDAFRAYLTADGAPARLTINFDGEETTGVTDVRGKMEDVRSEYFDLSGRRVSQPTKGLYIVNGKKVVMK